MTRHPIGSVGAHYGCNIQACSYFNVCPTWSNQACLSSEPNLFFRNNKTNKDK